MVLQWYLRRDTRVVEVMFKDHVFARTGRTLRHVAAGLAILSLIVFFLVRRAPAQSERPVIVLVSVDTLRADHLRSYGYWRETSPFIDKLAGEGTVFDECVVPLPATGPSHASLLTSRSPWKHGLVANGLSMAEGIDTLAAALKRVGYYTAGVVAVPHIGASYGFGHGFDSFVEPFAPHEGDDIRSDSGAVNASVRTAVERYLARRRREPLFLFVHYFDCHFPYRWWDPKDPDKAIVWTPEETAKKQKQLLRYDSGIRHVDAAIQQLHDYLSRKGLSRNMIFVVTADHGEQIGDHGTPVGHADIYRETVHVPLIMNGPGLPHRHVSEVVSSMDVGVTLTRMAGAQLEDGYDGVDLQSPIDRAAPWGLGLLAGPVPTRLLTVIGTPTYTRSIALIDGSKWFIKNFDHHYRNAWIMTPAPAIDRPPLSAPAAASATDGVTYKVPVRRYEPYFVTIEHVTVTPGCEATALVTILPSTLYFQEPIKFKGSIRLVVPAARLDSLALYVAPVACAGKTFYRASRVGAVELPQRSLRQTDLYNWLLTDRKVRKQDELYDVRQDAAMVHTIDNHSELAACDRALAERFREVAAFDVSNQVVPKEEQERLRSLGYLH